jgi:hypothetical protein
MGRDRTRQNATRSVPPIDVTTDTIHWARWAFSWDAGQITIGWSATGAGSLAGFVGASRPPPSIKGWTPARARRRGEWVARMLTAARPTLERLAAQGLRPHEVLDVIATVELFVAPPTRHRRKLEGDRKQRHRDAAILERAAALLPRYRPILEEHTPRLRVEVLGTDQVTVGHAYKILAEPGHLRRIAENLRAMPAPTGRQDWSLLLCARALHAVIARRAGRADARDVGELIRAAWPERYRPYHDEAAAAEADTARKLLARARKAVDPEDVEAILGADGLHTRPPTVPENVPAATRNQPKTTPRRSQDKRKTR